MARRKRILTTVARELKMLRFRHSLTQRQLAEKLGVHVMSVKFWETGACSPNFNNVMKLHDLFPELKLELEI